jgi:signal transduction histidine kinase
LCDYVEVVRRQAGITCTLSAKLPERLPMDQEIVLHRVAQEALTNVARHSRAASVRVELAGGTWTVWSRRGSGTVLTATLPKARVAA